MIWLTRRGPLDLARRGAIMGIVNVTPDSFSDGGSHRDAAAARDAALRLIDEGADIVDIGGESTRPGAEPVPVEEELSRVLPVIGLLRPRTEALLSIDTSKAAVARAALDLGVDIVNDITALCGDPGMAGAVAESGAGVILMHMLGTPQTMQREPHYDDVVREVGDFFRQRIGAAVASGINPMCIALDPGIGFGKTVEHNARLLGAIGSFSPIGRPVVVGVSRKSFLGSISGTASMPDRLWPAVALTSFCREAGAHIFRVHEARPHREALRMTEAILGHD